MNQAWLGVLKYPVDRHGVAVGLEYKAKQRAIL